MRNARNILFNEYFQFSCCWFPFYICFRSNLLSVFHFWLRWEISSHAVLYPTFLFTFITELLLFKFSLLSHQIIPVFPIVILFLFFKLIEMGPSYSNHILMISSVTSFGFATLMPNVLLFDLQEGFFSRLREQKLKLQTKFYRGWRTPCSWESLCRMNRALWPRIRHSASSERKKFVRFSESLFNVSAVKNV